MTPARRLAHLTAIFATAAAGFLAAEPCHAAGSPVRIIELPRVTVIGKRLAPEPVQIAAKAAPVATMATAPAPRITLLPRVVVIAKRPLPATTVIAERKLRESGV